MSGISLLKSILVSQFAKTGKNNGKVIVLEAEDSVRHAMQTLVANQIYSAPVYSEKEGQYIGMFDMIDVVEFIAVTFEKAEMIGPGFEAILEQAERFGTAKLHEVTDFSKRDPFVPVPDDADMYPIVEILADCDVHRVNVFDSEGKLANIITQSAVVDMLASRLNDVKDIASKTVAELKLGSSPVVSVDISQDTIQAFKALRRHKIYAIPVVNKSLNGAIVANISAKDVRAVCGTPAQLHLLHEPISHFLATLHQDDIDIRTPSITVNPSDTLGAVIQKLVVNRIHRVYTLNDDNSPRSVITLTDILKVFVD